MGDTVKARRDIFTLLHHGLDILAYRAPGGAQKAEPLEGGYELLSLAQALEKLPALCLKGCPLSAAEMRAASQEAVEQVVAWVAPKVQVLGAKIQENYDPVKIDDRADRALKLLEIGIKLITADLAAWVDGDFKEDALTPAALAAICKPAAYQIQTFQETGTGPDPLVAFIERLPSYSTAARIMEASGALAEGMLETLLDASLEKAAAWVSRGVFRSEQNQLAAEVRLVSMYSEVSSKPLGQRPVSWFGPRAGLVFQKARLIEGLEDNVKDTALNLANGFVGTLSELLRAAEELS